MGIGSNVTTPTTDGQVRAAGSITASYGGASTTTIGGGSITFGDSTSQSSAAVPITGGTFTGNITVSNTSPSIKLNDTTAGADDVWLSLDGNVFTIYKDDNTNDGAMFSIDIANSTATLFGNSVITSTIQNSGIRISSLAVGVDGTITVPSTAGEIRASGSITAYYSDERLKTDVQVITDAINKIETLRGVTYSPNDLAVSLGYKRENQVGLLAQEVQAVLPEAVKIAPFDADENGESKSGENYLTVQYEKLIPLLVEAIKQLNKEVQELKGAK